MSKEPKQFARLLETVYAVDHDECINIHDKPWYKTVAYKGKHRGAHNWVARLVHGDPPDGKPQACHRCSNRACINPRHIYWGSAVENAADHQATEEGYWASRKSRKLTDEDVAAIRATPRCHGVGVRLARQYGVSRYYISKIRRGALRT